MELLKKIGVLCLCGLLMMRVMIAPIIYLEYEFNRDYITKNFCVNKNRPQLHCNGKCYLAKKLKATQERDEHQSKISAFKFWFEVYHRCQNCFNEINTTPNVIAKTLRYTYLDNYFLSPIASILKPPQL